MNLVLLDTGSFAVIPALGAPSPTRVPEPCAIDHGAVDDDGQPRCRHFDNHGGTDA